MILIYWHLEKSGCCVEAAKGFENVRYLIKVHESAVRETRMYFFIILKFVKGYIAVMLPGSKNGGKS